MHIAWVTNPGEVELDMTLIRDPRLTLRVWPILPPSPIVTSATPERPNWVPVPQSQSADEVLHVLRNVVESNPDLIIFRAPFWLGQVISWDAFHRMFHGRRVLMWMSEQGPLLDRAMTLSSMFSHVAVNNRLDYELYRAQFPSKHILYLPFGVVWWPHSTTPHEYDVMGDGGAHYACGCEGGVKRDSVDVMIKPFITKPDIKLALWGSKDALHGWPGVPGVTDQFKGSYPWERTCDIVRSSRIYLGHSWNFRHSGYGVKLARAFQFAACVVWHRTAGMELDGIHDGQHCMTASSWIECADIVEWLLKHDEARLALRVRGREFALANWNWADNLLRVAKEMGA